VLPRASGLATTSVDLRITGMDEGLRVEVDGRAVRYLTRRDFDDAGGTITVPLFGQALPPAADGGHVVRLVHLDDCGATRPLVVQLLARGPTDAGDEPGADGGVDPGLDEAGQPTGGCCQSSGGGRAGSGGLALIVFAFVWRRRRARR